MPCFHPVKGFLSTAVDGRRKLHFHPTCSNDVIVWVPCGQCSFCRMHKAVEWTVRLTHEARYHARKCFVTLTYDDYHVPQLDDGRLTLSDYRDVQKFFKRLRKDVGKLRYYVVGEYGSRTERPHYHAIIFGWEPVDLVIHHYHNGHPVYTSQYLADKWDQGYITVGSVTNQSIGYVSKYCMKKRTGKMQDSWYSGRRPEFARMSLKPGIGEPWLRDFWRDVYKVDPLGRTVLQDCVRMSMRRCRPPEYYDRKLAGLSSDTLPSFSSYAWHIVESSRAAFAREQGEPDLEELRKHEENFLYKCSQRLTALLIERKGSLMLDGL